MYAKLFASILDSSVWLQPHHVVRVWMTLLAAKDEKGYARFATIENLRARARVTVKECEDAVRALEAPDPESSSPAMEGRRIVRKEGGWLVVNAELYDRLVTRAHELEMNRDRVAKHRAGKSTSEPMAVPASTPHVRPEQPPPDPAFEQFWASYPKRAGTNPKIKAKEQWEARKKFGINPLAMQDGAIRYAKFVAATGDVGTKFVLQAVTFLGRECHFNEPWTLPEKQNGKVNPGLQQMANILGGDHD